MVEQKDSIAKILVVSGESFSSALMEYALKMAQRLDFEIISLNVNEKIMTLTGEKRDAAITDFYELAKKSAGVRVVTLGSTSSARRRFIL